MTDVAFLTDEPGPGGVVYRALRDDAEFPFVVVGPGDTYEVVREDGDVDGAGGAILITRDEGWAPPAGRQGYLGSRLLRGGEGGVLLVRWSSPLMYARYLKDGPAPADGALYQPADGS